jgi:hypothetical protein
VAAPQLREGTAGRHKNNETHPQDSAHREGDDGVIVVVTIIASEESVTLNTAPPIPQLKITRCDPSTTGAQILRCIHGSLPEYRRIRDGVVRMFSLENRPGLVREAEHGPVINMLPQLPLSEYVDFTCFDKQIRSAEREIRVRWVEDGQLTSA